MKMSLSLCGILVTVFCLAETNIVDGIKYVCHDYGDGISLEGDFDKSSAVRPTPAIIASKYPKIFEIPSAIEGKMVTRIGIGALQSPSGVSLLVIPPTISSISAAAFLGGYLSSDSSMALYNPMSPGSGINDILFLGDCPCVTANMYQTLYDGSSYPSGDGWTYIFPNSNSSKKFSVTTYPSGIFSGCNCWIVEGSKNWNTNQVFCAGKVKYGAVKVNFNYTEMSVAQGCLMLSCTNSFATIYYTLDGTDPSTNATGNCHIYNSPIYITEQTLVKAIASVPSYPYTIIESGSFVPIKCTCPTISPGSGTVFDSSLSVNISFPYDEAIIHYTTNGATPTIESPVYERFKIYNRTTIKAIAFWEDGTASDMTVVEYAKGNSAPPVISPSDGATFQYSNQDVSITREGTDGTLRYTLDGSEPTVDSPVYTGSFTISETTTIKAKIFGDTYFDSAITTAVLTREWLTVVTPIITVPESFSGTKVMATITCTTADAVIRYTTDGSEPNSHSTKYAGPFDVMSSCTIKAKAFKKDCFNSSVATAVVTKVWAIGDALGDPDRTFTTDTVSGWTRDTFVFKSGEDAMRSGTLTNSILYGTFVTSTMSTTVNGKGTIRFWWKASCEDDIEWDHGVFTADGKEWTIYGETDWQQVIYTFETDGDHILNWQYLKDDFSKAGSDCIWVDQFCWTPKGFCTETTSTPVPYVWIDDFYAGVTDYETCVSKLAANGVNTIEEAYVVGLSPTNKDDVFTAAITMTNGVPYLIWSPNLNTNGTQVLRAYKIWGKETLDANSTWEYPTNDLHRFFKVSVEMP